VTAALAALAASPRARLAALALAAALAAGLALAPGETGPAAARGLLAAAGLAALLVVARRRPASVPAPARLAVVERAALGRDAGVALVEVDGRRVLVGFGAGGVRRLAELPARGAEVRP
jgi:flagellar protein FliO/FliZ